MRNIEPTKFDAVRALVDGTIGGSSDAEIINYHNGQTPPTKEAIESKYAELCQEWIDQEYARNREIEYPSIIDVTGALAEKTEGDSTMWDEITAKRAEVKTKWPKDNSGPV